MDWIDKIQLMTTNSNMGGNQPAMKYVELPFDNNWRWLAAIVIETIDAERDTDSQQKPLLDITAECSPFTGEYTLYINQGGLKNRGTPKAGKALFKETVLPYLMQVTGVSSPITGNLVLSLNRGNISSATLQYK